MKKKKKKKRTIKVKKNDEKDVEKNEKSQQMELDKIWNKKTRQAMKWAVVLCILMVWAVVYSAVVLFTSTKSV